ncbi:Na+/H+ antiporter subunit E [Pseudothauera lacus]|uniref:Cation:proton antiporter n=1 Tax=Pseudothauera lacus TaxID=2136175 RepID=A0A2T4IGP9_9RHOO|nr:Na+/H+ antiporter subunit E [Pseudothauera lacus]PTD96947.1 cation:proton antiporter [Pseudothauera lacus]
MLAVHLLLAVGLAAFADALSPSGVVLAFVLIYVLLRLSSRLLGMRAYVVRLELGVCFVGWFALEILKASLDVARLVLARRVAIAPAVLRVRLVRRDERVATLLGCLLTLTPGTLALDYDAAGGVLYVHALDTDGASAVEDSVRRIEARLLAWLDAGRPAREEVQ